MEMGALNNIKSSEACVRAVEAGADIILLPLDVDSTINAIKEREMSALKSFFIIVKFISKRHEIISYEIQSHPVAFPYFNI